MCSECVYVAFLEVKIGLKVKYCSSRIMWAKPDVALGNIQDLLDHFAAF